MKQNYMDMSINEIIKLIENKDKRIEKLENKLSEISRNIKIVGRENDRLKNNNKRYKERIVELYNGKIIGG